MGAFKFNICNFVFFSTPFKVRYVCAVANRRHADYDWVTSVVRFGVLMSVLLKMEMFWDTEPSKLFIHR
jgi:hypothetical protein